MSFQTISSINYDAVDESDEEIKRIFGTKRDFRYNISFIDPSLGVFGEIFLSVMIFPEGFSPSEGSINDNNYINTWPV